MVNYLSERLFYNSPRLGYLSAAPRVSTNPAAEASGPRAHVLGVISAFKDLGFEVFPYIVGDEIPFIITKHSGNYLEKSPILRLFADIVRLFSGFFHSLKSWIRLHKKVDVVYERFSVFQALGWIFQNNGTPWILETSGLYFYEAKVERKSILLISFARLIEIWSYRRCDILICVSDALKELIIHETGISDKKILVVPNGVDCKRFDPTKQTPVRLFLGPTIGFVGALLHWHRLDILLSALEELSIEGVLLNLVVVGDGPMRTEWENLVIKLGLNCRITFVGQISWDEIPSYIAGFDLGYIGNNLMEIGSMYHSPLKLYEYMSMALPVIATDFFDSRDMVIPGQTGYLFEPGNIEDLKRILRLAYYDQYKWKKMGESARQQVIERASWRVRVESMIVGIEKILNK